MLQGPGMLQLRQRVTARCHLGALDEDDTRAYIEHRLLCAGAIDKPVFAPGVFHAIHQHAGGIPRRINTLCDRLLLQGYLNESVEITLASVEAVVSEMREENAAPIKTAPGPRDAWAHLDAIKAAASATKSKGLADADLGSAVGLLAEVERELTNITAEQLSARLLRMERSILRQERVSIEILSALKKIVSANRSAGTGRKTRSDALPK